MKDVVKYINENNVYVRDELGNILKHHAHIASFNLNDSQKKLLLISMKNKTTYPYFTSAKVDAGQQAKINKNKKIQNISRML